MPHSWESAVRREVASWLIDHGYTVRSNVYLSESYRYADLIAEGPLCVFAIEVENGFDSVFAGVSQAAVYAEGVAPEYPHKPVQPLVALPDEHIEHPERQQIEDRTGIQIVGWPPR